MWKVLLCFPLVIANQICIGIPLRVWLTLIFELENYQGTKSLYCFWTQMQIQYEYGRGISVQWESMLLFNLKNNLQEDIFLSKLEETTELSCKIPSLHRLPEREKLQSFQALSQPFSGLRGNNNSKNNKNQSG